ncbi:MAG: alanyl-tRNA editing protein [Bacillota bacterium]|nr:alanyl-tRNA editing protein [Bacillota bacterium]
MDAVSDRRFQFTYNRDVRRRELVTRIVALHERGASLWVALEDTVFYPEGGGQPGDRGRLLSMREGCEECFAVRDARYRNDYVEHEIAPQDQQRARLLLEPGLTVRAEIDWERRFELMQQHSAEHLISGLVRQLHGWNNVGFHINEELMTLDFDGPLEADEIVDIERRVQAAIYAELPVRVLYHENGEDIPPYRSKIDIPGTLRIVEVPGIDRCACSGTHVTSTGEIGQLLITDAVRYKGGVRLSALAGWRAARLSRVQLERERELGALFSVPSGELLTAAAQLFEKREELIVEGNRLRQALVDEAIRHLQADGRALMWLELPLLDAVSLARAAESIAARGDIIAVVTTESGEHRLLAARSAAADGEAKLAALAAAMKRELGFRGGGRGGFIQGRVSAAGEEIERFFHVWNERA